MILPYPTLKIILQTPGQYWLSLLVNEKRHWEPALLPGAAVSCHTPLPTLLLSQGCETIAIPQKCIWLEKGQERVHLVTNLQLYLDQMLLQTVPWQSFPQEMMPTRSLAKASVCDHSGISMTGSLQILRTAILKCFTRMKVFFFLSTSMNWPYTQSLSLDFPSQDSHLCSCPTPTLGL